MPGESMSKKLLGVIIIMGLCLGTLVFYSKKKEKLVDINPPESGDLSMRFDFNEMKKNNSVETEEDFRTIIAFVKYSLKMGRKIKIGKIHWFGIPSWQSPGCNWAMQELITEIKPDFIVETGTAQGGTTLFYATILEKINKTGKVITVDINPQVEEASRFDVFKKMVIIIKGDSVSSDVINEISKYVTKNSKVLVTLDTQHIKEHTLKELKLYSNFVSLNNYIVVQGMTRYLHDPDNGPRGAIKEFLKTNKNFEIDYSKKRANFRCYYYSFLKRVK